MSKKIEVYRKYYVLLNDGQEVIDYKIPWGKKGTTWKNVYDGDIVKVLGPVPSFKEVELMKKNLRTLAKLKELLKECVSYVNHRCIKTRETLTRSYTSSDKVLHNKAEKLLTKIDGALR